MLWNIIHAFFSRSLKQLFWKGMSDSLLQVCLFRYNSEHFNTAGRSVKTGTSHGKFCEPVERSSTETSLAAARSQLAQRTQLSSLHCRVDLGRYSEPLDLVFNAASVCQSGFPICEHQPGLLVGSLDGRPSTAAWSAYDSTPQCEESRQAACKHACCCDRL